MQPKYASRGVILRGMVSIVYQQPGSKICGQCCVAMLAGVPLNEVLAVFGQGGTTTRDLLGLLRRFGVEPRSEKLIRVRWALPEACIVRVPHRKYPNGHGSGYHWCVYVGGVLLDPAGGHSTKARPAWVTSYLPVELPAVRAAA